MQKFYGKVTDVNGNPVAGARLTVYTENVISPLPTLFAESNGALVSYTNPILSDSNGEYSFVVAPGSYSVKATGSSAVLNISKTVTEYVPTVVDSAVEAVPVTLNRLVLTATSAWVAPAGVIQATVTGVGGGAGGKGGDPTNGGVGGGAGATVVRTLPVIPGATYAITIGAGGTGGAGSTTAGVAGTSGGDTTFGSLLTAKGGVNTGAGGRGTTAGFGGSNALSVVANTSAPIFYGRGGIAAGGDGGAGGVAGVTATGSPGYSIESFPAGGGGSGRVIAPAQGGGGGGGASAFGGGGNGGNNTTGANTGGNGLSPIVGYGGGGGGGATGVTTGGNGANGNPGCCIVEWIS